MRAALVVSFCLTTLLASGCGRDTPTVSEPPPEAAGPSSPAETAPDTPLAGPADGGGPCAAGFLPLTGLCADPSPDRFAAVDAELQPFDAACVWKTMEVPVSDTQALLFRTQDCSAKGWEADTFRWQDGALWARPASLPDEPGFPVLTVFELAPGQTAQQAALDTLETAPPEQRDHCEISERPGMALAGEAFELAPSADLMAALEAASGGEPFDACGRYGLTDADRAWEAREGRALFHSFGQDSPMWDPASFTFYQRGPDGVWRKDGG